MGLMRFCEDERVTPGFRFEGVIGTEVGVPDWLGGEVVPLGLGLYMPLARG
jgi:hypothetical protein